MTIIGRINFFFENIEPATARRPRKTFQSCDRAITCMFPKRHRVYNRALVQYRLRRWNVSSRRSSNAGRRFAASRLHLPRNRQPRAIRRDWRSANYRNFANKFNSNRSKTAARSNFRRRAAFWRISDKNGRRNPHSRFGRAKYALKCDLRRSNSALHAQRIGKTDSFYAPS